MPPVAEEILILVIATRRRDHGERRDPDHPGVTLCGGNQYGWPSGIVHRY
ncbi:MAG: hypothetical protein H6Q90_1736 [Deltaproteobacteria bacterium]|nr:hypothetical protein [Deltaproteobacteria bacterium]